jgi:hypothetical protein
MSLCKHLVEESRRERWQAIDDAQRGPYAGSVRDLSRCRGKIDMLHQPGNNLRAVRAHGWGNGEDDASDDTEKEHTCIPPHSPAFVLTRHGKAIHRILRLTTEKPHTGLLSAKSPTSAIMELVGH